MSFVFNKELPQSSLKSDDGQSLLCIDKFDNPPRTLYDEIGQQDKDFYHPQTDMDWKSVVYRLQIENTSLINSLHEANTNLLQSRREKEDLENFIQRQTETTDQIVSRLRSKMENLMKQQEKYSQLLTQQKLQTTDLIFQKNYVLLENEALRESQKEIQAYYGIQPIQRHKSLLFKWRACVYAVIALQRFLSFSN
ncbi:uncharacterized protein B0P05DRAFT_544558 [Gilbertella persicaria]|uniref:uncharacterized protein n=1 Tax=Gilbertella persicaria TaxID=101096 RepID=UPI00221E6053|nr:uncharacterized protein B0P05DRAFT_544558 [Gilbertella persicaria]KAI8077312.1 hypothetical protein B0P05DRAFT_544558 [Gilbertella persicaria]